MNPKFKIILGVIMLALIINTNSAITADNGLVAYWSFDNITGNTAPDETGNNNGTIYGAKVVDGISGKGLDFYENDYVDLGDSSSMAPESSITLEAWIYPTTVSGCHRIIDRFTNNPDIGYSLLLCDNDSLFQLKAGGSLSEFLVENVFTAANQWYHIAGTYDNSFMRIYINGVLVGTPIQKTGAINYGSANTIIGRTSYPGVTQYFNGIIDEVKIYNRALTAEEIKAEYDKIMFSNDVLNFSENIEDGGNWNFWGAPKAYVDMSVGNPPPSIKGNGNGWYLSGALSKKKFNYSNGLCIKLDAKVADTISVRAGHIGLSNSDDWWNWNDNADWAVDGEIAYMQIYGGVNNHVRVYGVNGRWINTDTLTLYNMTKPVNISLWNSTEWGNPQCTDEYYDNNWHNYEICILQNGTVNFYADGVLKCTSRDTILMDGKEHNIILSGHDPEYWYDNIMVHKGGEVCSCTDNDNDGYGVCPNCNTSCGCQYDGNDCNDSNASINPKVSEIFNGVDDDCDGIIDEKSDYVFYDTIKNGNNWNFWGAPKAYVDMSVGNPPPSIKANGDGWYHSGVLSKQKFDYSNGLCISFDAKVTDTNSVRAGHIGLANSDDYMNWDDGAGWGESGELINIQIYGGAANHTRLYQVNSKWINASVWGNTQCTDEYYDNNWHTYKMCISPDMRGYFYVDGILKCTSKDKLILDGKNHSIIATGHDPEYWYDNFKVSEYEGLIAYWSFDNITGNTAPDDVGNNNGTIYGAKVVDGISGKALEFDGIDDYVDFTSPVLNKGPFSACFWIKPTSQCINDGKNHYAIANGGETAGSYGFYFNIEWQGGHDGDWSFGVKNSDGIYIGAATPASSTDWTFICGTLAELTEDTVKLYLDGNLAATGVSKQWSAGSPNNLRIGAPSNLIDYIFNGIIDEVKIYNRALTAEEIKAEYDKINKPEYRWWDCLWQYRKEINIEENSGKELVDYPVNFTFDVSNMRVKEDCSDLRFIDSGKELSYWIESCNNSKAKVWVKVNLTANEKKTIQMYYGNPQAESKSNGDNVFEFFDDFEHGSFSKWDRVDQIDDNGWFIDSFIKYKGNYSAKGWDSDTISDPWRSYALVKNFTSTSFVYELNVRMAENNRWHYPFLLHMKDGKDAYTIQAGPWGHWMYLSSSGYRNFPNDKQYFPNTWYKLKIKINESRYRVWVNEDMLTSEEGVDLVSWGDLQKVEGIQSINLLPGCGDSGEGFDGRMWIDNLFIYSYVYAEPKISIGTEKQSSCKTIEPWWNCSTPQAAMIGYNTGMWDANWAQSEEEYTLWELSNLDTSKPAIFYVKMYSIAGGFGGPYYTEGNFKVLIDGESIGEVTLATDRFIPVPIDARFISSDGKATVKIIGAPYDYYVWYRGWEDGQVGNLSRLIIQTKVEIASVVPNVISVIAPSTVYLGAAAVFTAEIVVYNVFDFAGAQFNLTFNPDVVQVIGHSTGNITGSGHITNSTKNKEGYDNLIINNYNTPSTGSGSIALITFKVVGLRGTSTHLNLSNVKLSNSVPEPITVASINNAKVKVKAVPKGDSDGNGAVNIFDVIWAEKIAVGIPGPFGGDADSDCDGNVDIFDVIWIEKIAVGIPGKC